MQLDSLHGVGHADALVTPHLQRVSLLCHMLCCFAMGSYYVALLPATQLVDLLMATQLVDLLMATQLVDLLMATQLVDLLMATQLVDLLMASQLVDCHQISLTLQPTPLVLTNTLHSVPAPTPSKLAALIYPTLS